MQLGRWAYYSGMKDCLERTIGTCRKEKIVINIKYKVNRLETGKRGLWTEQKENYT